MCQQGPEEISYYRQSELQQVRQKLRDYADGKITLTEEEANKLMVEYAMLREN